MPLHQQTGFSKQVKWLWDLYQCLKKQISLIDLNSVHKPVSFWKTGPTRLDLSKEKAYIENLECTVFSFNYHLLCHLTPPPGRRQEGSWAEPARQLTIVSPPPSGSTVHGQVHNWIRFARQHQSTTGNEGLALSLLRLPHKCPQEPLVSHWIRSPSRPWVPERLGPNRFGSNTCTPGPSRLQGTLQILNRCFSSPPASGGPKQPMRCGRSLGNLGVSQGKEGCLFFELFLQTLPILALFWYNSKLGQTDERFPPCFFPPLHLSQTQSTLSSPVMRLRFTCNDFTPVCHFHVLA